MYVFHTCLTRSANDNDSIFRINEESNLTGKVDLTKISLMIRRVLPNDEQKYKLYKTMKSVKKLDFAFRMRQCSVVEVPETTSMSWRLGLTSVSEKL